MASGVEFSQFINGGTLADGDTVVGLRSGKNTQFVYGGDQTPDAQYLAEKVTQTAHGFLVGQAIRLSGAVYVLSQANNVINAEMIGIVSEVIDANHFMVTVSGKISVFTGLTPGQVYFLDDVTAGALNSSPPITPTYVEKPVLIADSATSGYLINYRGKIIPNPDIIVGFKWNVITASQTMVADNGYICNSGSLITLTLPANIGIGDEFVVINKGVGGFLIAQRAGQNILISDQASTVGVTGSVSASSVGTIVSIVCISTNAQLINMTAPNGFITVT